MYSLLRSSCRPRVYDFSAGDPCNSTALNDCSVNAICSSSKIGFICQCKPGFVDVSPNLVTLPGRNCIPVTPVGPEEPGKQCDPKQTGAQCTNGMICAESSGTSAVCQCPPDTVHLQGGYCYNPDPCQAPNVDCDTINGYCVPTLFGFTCQCKAGFKDVSSNPKEPGRKCVQRKSCNFCNIH